jgi:uncharacterized protein YggE
MAIRPGPGVAYGAMGAAVPGRVGNSRQISVTGRGEVGAAPNELVATFDVSTVAPSIEECAVTQRRKVKKLVRALKQAAGAKAEIAVASPYFSPATMPAIRPAAPEPARQEWVFNATVTAYADSLPTLGKVIDAAMAAGATGVGSSGFRSESPGATAPVFNPEVSGSGAARPQPYASLQIEVRAESASAATTRGSQVTDRVKRAVEDALGGKGRVEAARFWINRRPQSPRYRWQQPAPRPGFRGSTTVGVETRDLGRMGAIVTAGRDVGAPPPSVRFTLSDDSPAFKEAVKRASRDAEAKAAEIAKARGAKLGGIVSFQSQTFETPELVYGPPSPPLPSLQLPGANRATTVQSGHLAVSANVYVRYAIK